MEKIDRPKIKIPLILTDYALEILGALVVIGFWAYTLLHYHQLPDIIPTHFGAEGKPDGYGAKWTIISLPIVGTILYVGLTIICRFPHLFNYMTTITAANALKQYTIVTRMLRMLKVMVLLVFFLLDYQTIRLALHQPDLFGKWFLLLVVSMVFVPLFYFLIQSSKNA